MKSLHLHCGPGAWPKSVHLRVALGVTSACDDRALWLIFSIEDGSIASTSGLLCKGAEMPPDVVACKPMIYFISARETWQLLNEKRSDFYQKVAKGGVHIGGDFRQFARLSDRFVKLGETTQLWNQLDDIIEELQNNG